MNRAARAQVPLMFGDCCITCYHEVYEQVTKEVPNAGGGRTPSPYSPALAPPHQRWPLLTEQVPDEGAEPGEDGKIPMKTETSMQKMFKCKPKVRRGHCVDVHAHGHVA